MINNSLIEAIKDFIVSWEACMLNIECLRVSHRFRMTNWIFSLNEMLNCCVNGQNVCFTPSQNSHFQSHLSKHVLCRDPCTKEELIGKTTPSQWWWNVRNTNGPCSAASILPPEWTRVVKCAERLRTMHPNLYYWLGARLSADPEVCLYSYGKTHKRFN